VKQANDDLRARAPARHAAKQELLASFEVQAERAIDATGVSTPLYIAYLNYYRELWKKANTYSSKVLKSETDAIIAKWRARNLDEEIMEQLRTVLGYRGRYPQLSGYKSNRFNWLAESPFPSCATFSVSSWNSGDMIEDFRLLRGSAESNAPSGSIADSRSVRPQPVVCSWPQTAFSRRGSGWDTAQGVAFREGKG